MVDVEYKKTLQSHKSTMKENIRKITKKNVET